MHITELKSTLSAITRIKVVTVWRLVEAFSRLGDPAIGVEMVRWAIEHAPAEAREVLQHMPARPPGISYLDALLYELDAGIRASCA